MQKTPKKIVYRRFPDGPTTMLILSDSAFKKEEESGHALKGVLYIRLPAAAAEPLGRNPGILKTEKGKQYLLSVCHILEFMSRSQKHVTRSTFASELFAACDAMDHGFLLAVILHQVQTGQCDISTARQLRERGGWATRIILAVDAMSIFAAITATQIKIPADSSLLSHLQYLRELLDHQVLNAFWWVDTRDMLADGLTKGAIDRAALHLAMGGSIAMSAEMYQFISPPNAVPEYSLWTQEHIEQVFDQHHLL